METELKEKTIEEYNQLKAYCKDCSIDNCGYCLYKFQHTLSGYSYCLYHTLIYHIGNGINSGIPICCILSFTKNRLKTYGTIGIHPKNTKNPKRTGVGYVQCENCQQNNYKTKIRRNGVIGIDDCLALLKQEIGSI